MEATSDGVVPFKDLQFNFRLGYRVLRSLLLGPFLDGDPDVV